MLKKIHYFVYSLAKRFALNVAVPLFRPIVWYIVFHELMRDPHQLEYVRVRTSLLDKYDELFPGAKVCSSRREVQTLAAQTAASSGVDGLWVEFGVFTGGSINHVARQIDSIIYGFDSFEGLPIDWKQGRTEVAVKKEYFAVGILPRVRRNVRLVKGWFEETLPGFKKEHEDNVSYMHIDSDIYESAKTVFHELGDRIVSGTVILFDEYFNFPSWEDHEYKAFMEFVEQRNLKFEYLAYNPCGEQVAVRIL